MYITKGDTVTAIMAENGMWHRAIILNVDNRHVTYGKLMIVFVPYPVTLVDLLSAVGVIVRVFVHNKVLSTILDMYYGSFGRGYLGNCTDLSKLMVGC